MVLDYLQLADGLRSELAAKDGAIEAEQRRLEKLLAEAEEARRIIGRLGHEKEKLSDLLGFTLQMAGQGAELGLPSNGVGASVAVGSAEGEGERTSEVSSSKRSAVLYAVDALEAIGTWTETYRLIEHMEKQGFKTSAKNPYTSVFSTLSRALKGHPRLDKVGGKWGLKEWPRPQEDTEKSHAPEEVQETGQGSLLDG